MTELAAVGAALVVALGLRLSIPVPWGGRVPLGLALAIALPALLPSPHYAGGAAGGIVLALLAGRHQLDRRGALHLAARAALAFLAGGVAAAVVDGGALAISSAAATGVLLVEIGWALGRGEGAPVRLASALPLHLTLVCAGVLFAVAVEQVGLAMAAVAILPLAVTHFAFGRHAAASETLRQTVQALGLVPELAGLAPLGHSERAAHYARAVAIELGFGPPDVERIVTATRLHHLGAVTEEPGGPSTASEVARRGAHILRDSGFPTDVAELLESARADGHGVAADALDAAVVRIASAFDHGVGEDPAATDRALALLGSNVQDPQGRRAVSTLLGLVAVRPTLVTDAIAAADRFRYAADGLDLAALVTPPADGDVLPFTTRRP